MSKNFTVYVAEDEPLARESLLHMLAAFAHWQVVGHAGDGEQALHGCLETTPDLLITDIRMPRLDGLELVAGLRAQLPTLQVVFITAYDQHAVTAFRLAAVDYLLKPVTDAEFAECVSRVENQIRAQQQLKAMAVVSDNAEHNEVSLAPLDAFLRDQRARLRHLVVRSVGRTDIVPLRDVIAFRATGNYLEVITASKCYLHRQTLKSLLDTLDPKTFVQIHRTAIVAIDQIRCIEKRESATEIVLADGKRFPLSVRYAEEVRKIWAPPT